MSQITEKDAELQAWYPQKTSLAKLAIQHEAMHKVRQVYQRGIYWVELGANIGREMGSLHPALVISDNQWNSGGTATILPLSSKTKQLWKTRYILKAKNYSTQTLNSGATLPGLSADSMVKADQPKTASIERFKGQIAIVNDNDWNIIQKRIKKYLGL